jgi:hypothetical protein
LFLATAGNVILNPPRRSRTGYAQRTEGSGARFARARSSGARKEGQDAHTARFARSSERKMQSRFFAQLTLSPAQPGEGLRMTFLGHAQECGQTRLWQCGPEGLTPGAGLM